MMGRRRPDPSELLTIADVDDLPNGTATVLTVERKDGREQRTGTIDDAGFVKAMKTGRPGYFRAGLWEVSEP